MKTTLTVFLLATSIAAVAGQVKPVTIKPLTQGTTAVGQSYASYNVACDNGSSYVITRWADAPKKWCLGTDSTEDCQKKKMRSAKAACNQPKVEPATWAQTK